MHGLGWMHELPDHRDYIIDQHPSMSHLFRGPMVLGAHIPSANEPSAVDLSGKCSPVEDQGRLGSCTANAVVGLVEYMERRGMDRHIDASRLFLYKVSRNLLGWKGDTGMYVRTAMKALKVFGAPPEEHWPYVVADFDLEPGAFAYAYAQRFRAISYYRFDHTGRSRVQLVYLLRRIMAYGLPVAFGFVVYSWGNRDGEFPVPEPGQKPYGGHAVVAVGYDDTRRIGDSEGALKIRNSWGTGWGKGGYGWLPYDYVKRGLSSDFWALYSTQYVRD